jgi:hypothetical protein
MKLNPNSAHNTQRTDEIISMKGSLSDTIFHEDAARPIKIQAERGLFGQGRLLLTILEAESELESKSDVVIEFEFVQKNQQSSLSYSALRFSQTMPPWH